MGDLLNRNNLLQVKLETRKQKETEKEPRDTDQHKRPSVISFTLYTVSAGESERERVSAVGWENSVGAWVLDIEFSAIASHIQHTHSHTPNSEGEWIERGEKPSENRRIDRAKREKETYTHGVCVYESKSVKYTAHVVCVNWSA